MAKRTERKTKGQRKRAKNTPVMFRLAPGQLDRLNAISKRAGVSRNAVLCVILDEEFGIVRKAKAAAVAKVKGR